MGVAPGEACFRVRPAVPMGYYEGVPFVCALGAAQALGPGARLVWPHEVQTASGERVSVRARAGYDGEGMFADCTVDLGSSAIDPAAAEEAARARLDAWASDVAAGRAAAGPLAPVLGEYFDALLGMGETVEVLRADRVVARGALVAADVWGRATVRLEDGQELELSAGQAELRAV